MGVIDSLGKGFQIVLRHWWLILIPVLLDSFLWLGPRASVADLAQQGLQALDTEAIEAPSGETADVIRGFQTAMKDVIERYNAFTVLRIGALGIPSLTVWSSARLSSPAIYEVFWITFLGMIDMPDLLVSISDASFMNASVWNIHSGWALLLSSILLTALGIGLGSVYLTSISMSLRPDQEAWPFWSRAWRLGIRFALFWVLRALFLVVAGVPLLLVFGLLSLINPALALLFSTVILGLGTWLSFYGVFFAASLVMNDATVWHAIWNSVGVVLRGFWATLSLFIVINLIGGGLTILWQRLGTGSWLTLLAIVGNAFVGTSLVAGSLVFYQERYSRWQQAIEELLANQNKRLA